MKPKNGEPVYKLIHSQEMVQYMWKYSVHKQSTQVPLAIAFDEELDFRILARAVNVEIERNDCMRLRIFREKLRVKQFFLDEYKLDKIQIKKFSSKEEQVAYFDSVASAKLDVFGGEMFRVIFFRTHENKCGIFIVASHIIMDFAAAFMFFKDLMAVYDSLKNNTPMPRPLSKYEDIIIKEQDNPELEERIKREGKLVDEWMAKDRVPFYNAINGPKVLDMQRKLLHKKDMNMPHIYLPVLDSTNLVKCHLSDEDSKKIDGFIKENQLSPEWVIQLGFRIYLSKLNYHTNDTLFWVLCPRRRTVKEKRCGGTLASPMPWREILDDDKSFIDTIRQLSESQIFLFRHSDVPFTDIRQLERDRYGLSLMQTANSMMFSFLPAGENAFGDRKYEFSAYNFGHYVMPVYALTMQEASTGRFVFSYIHRLFLTKDEDVYKFNDGVVRTLLKGVENPDKTIGEILEEI
ncbi:MAG: hypothetical protein E7573_06695 [Ruminococcaceae bacterium]|nr:hypothetical protein [Oscillospiraceae bacterium]MBR3597437.1 hypothetical protein [Clostridia bacterium]